MAEWVQFSSGDNKSTTYADPSSVRKVGHVAKVWELIDLKEASTTTPKPFLSAAMQKEYDCKGEQSRIISISYFPNNMRQGEVLHTDDSTDKWSPVVPGSVGELIFKLACKKMPKWIEIGSDGNLTTYIDSASIHKKDGRVKMWDLYDFETTRELGGAKFKSYKRLTEYDCKESQYRTLADSFHYGNMGIGGLLAAHDSTGNWEPVLPESIVETSFKFACKK